MASKKNKKKGTERAASSDQQAPRSSEPQKKEASSAASAKASSELASTPPVAAPATPPAAPAMVAGNVKPAAAAPAARAKALETPATSRPAGQGKKKKVPAGNGHGNGHGNGNGRGIREIVVHGHAAEVLAEMKHPDERVNIAPDHVHDDVKSFWRKYIFSTDHKVIAVQFMLLSLFFLIVAGMLALIVRWQLGFPDQPMPGGKFFPRDTFVSKDGAVLPQFYNQAYSMHASIMIFLVIIPMLVGAFANFLIPLQIGARDMAFPFYNGLSFWVAVVAGTILSAGFFVEGGSAAAGWTSYPPISTLGGLGQQLWFVGVFILGLSSIMGAVNYLTTIINYRAPGMTLMRMPLTVWSLFITSLLILFSTPVLGAAMIMQFLDGYVGTSFFIPDYAHVGGSASDILKQHSGHGHPLIYQHLFWFYSHPAVYIMILPAMGIVSEILSTFARKPIFGYKAMVGALALIAFLGYIVWGHHMFVSGMNPYMGTTFMVSTMFIAVPSAIKTFNWLGTLWGGSIRYTTPMMFALGFVSMFVIGGLSGIFMANSPVDIYIHDTYFIVGHIHYVLFGGSMFGIFAGIYHWYPKMFGRMMNETLGKVHFWLTFFMFNMTFFPMHIIGVGGMMRRIPDPTFYEFLRPLQPLNTLMTVSALGLGVAQLLFVYNFMGSLFARRRWAMARAAVAALAAALVAAGTLGAILRFAPGGGDTETVKQIDLGLEAVDGFDQYGLEVTRVYADSAAAEAGVKPGDILVSMGGEKFQTIDGFFDVLDRQEPDQPTPLVVRRAGKETTLEIKPSLNSDDPESEYIEIGAELPLGARVVSVESGSPAARAGLKPGDYILAVEGREIGHVDDFHQMATGWETDLAARWEAARNAGEANPDIQGSALAFDILRQGQEQSVSVTPRLSVSDRYVERLPDGAISKNVDSGAAWSIHNALANGYWIAVGLVFAFIFVGLLVSPAATLRVFAVALVAIAAIPVGKVLDVTLDIASSSSNSLTVEAVAKSGAADKATLKPGDVIVAVDGRDVLSQRELLDKIQAAGPGGSVQLEVNRGAEVVALSLKPEFKEALKSLEAEDPREYRLAKAAVAEGGQKPLELNLGLTLSRASLYHGENFKAPGGFKVPDPVFFLFPWLHSWASVFLTLVAMLGFGWWAAKANLLMGAAAPDNPWEATTLEWVACTSPPWYANFKRLPRVYHGPHEYNVPGVAEDYLPQTVSYTKAASGKTTETAAV
jgi:cytochrome c oxidase subunit 1